MGIREETRRLVEKHSMAEAWVDIVSGETRHDNLHEQAAYYVEGLRSVGVADLALTEEVMVEYLEWLIGEAGHLGKKEEEE